MMKDPRARMGADNEERAGRYLAARGHHIIERNYRCKVGEVDLVTRCGEFLCFVEVRSRTEGDMGAPLETIGPRKQRRVARVAQHYLARRRLSCVMVRFDVLGITITPRGVFYEFVENAFESPF
jgi:putative endonuclease